LLQYAPSSGTTYIRVAAGYYQESTWEIYAGKNVELQGRMTKDETFITVGSQNYDGFIICDVGLCYNYNFFMYFYFYI
jgi:hypothetical protein